MNKRLYSIIFSCLLFAQLSAQNEQFVNYDHIYQDNIASVQFHINDFLLSYPIIDMNSGLLVELSFDDLDADTKNYAYRLVHCDANWQQSSLSDLEYIDGFNNERIDNFEYSYNTRTQYTHYRLQLPNEDIRLTKSGNYLLHVFVDDGIQTPVLTRRLMLVEPIVRINEELVRAARAEKLRTHQEIDFVINHKGVTINNPEVELKVKVLQNGRWDSAIEGLTPRFFRNEQITYDLQNKIVFPAGKEFRFVDMRSLRFRSPFIAAIDEFDDGFEVVVKMDHKRGDEHYVFFPDVNGKFILANFDDVPSLTSIPLPTRGADADGNGGTNAGLSAEDLIDQDVPDLGFDYRMEEHLYESEYADVYFSLDSPTELYDEDVYIFGGLTDWRIQDRYKMEYNEEDKFYYTSVFLKQGFYNYFYVTVPKGKKAPIAHEHTEGNWYLTENNYTILVYFRPFGERYDRLIGASHFNTID